MGHDVPFDPDEVCDGCGKLGAYDFYGDYYCPACLERPPVPTPPTPGEQK